MNNFEIEILNKIRELIPKFLDYFFRFITFFGGQEILILAIIIIYFIISKKDGQKIAYTIFFSLLFNNVLKVIVNRIRPFRHPNSTYQLPDSVTHGATGQSFPSGHSQNAATAYSAIILTYKNKRLKIILITLITLVAISRIMLAVHYPTDVLVGIIIGIGFAYLGLFLHSKFSKDFKSEVILNLITALIFLPFLFIYINKITTDYAVFKDLYTLYSFYIGFILAIILEHKFLNFNEDEPLKIRIIRTFIAIVIVASLMFGLKFVFPKDKMIFDMLRYFLLSFITIGIYPIVFKNKLFKKMWFSHIFLFS